MKYVPPMYNNEAVATEDIICVSDVVIVRNNISESNPITYVKADGPATNRVNLEFIRVHIFFARNFATKKGA